MVSINTQLPIVDRALQLLGEASYLMAQAGNHAEADTFSFNPLSAFSGILKYWKWNKAKKKVNEAASELAKLRGLRKDIPDVEGLEISKLDAINDMFDVLPFRTKLMGTPGGPSRLKQNLIGVEGAVANEIQTSRLGVDNLMSEVGLLHARLRKEAGIPIS